MTGTELLLLALIGLAFAGGWITHGITDGDQTDTSAATAIDRATAKLDDALAALSAARAMAGVDGELAAGLRRDAVRNLGDAAAALGPLERELADALGAEHPCVADYARARETVELVAGEVGAEGADRSMLAALERVATDARRRYGIGAAAVTALR